jgi:hypothetical protein
VAASAVALALASAWHSGRSVWHRLEHERTSFARLSDAQRRSFPIHPSDAFDFFAQYTVPGDRVYFQAPPGRRAAFAAAGRYYLLPALVAAQLADATVVLSYDADPTRLHLHFVTQRRDGRRQIYVSRIGVP